MTEYSTERMKDEEYVKSRTLHNTIFSDIIDVLKTKNADYFRDLSENCNKNITDNIINLILLQINGLSNVEGVRHFNTIEFKEIDNKIYNLIPTCDNMSIRKYFEEKQFKVSEWNDKNKYPTIYW